MTTVTQEQVLAKLARDDRYAVNCLLQLYARQTADERAEERTTEHNGVGFSAVDAELLSSFAGQVLAWRETPANLRQYHSPLSVKQMDLLRRKLPRYARQLTELTNAALAERAAYAERAGAARSLADRVLGPLPPMKYHPLPAHLVEHLRDEMPAIVHAVTTPLLADELPAYDEEDPFGCERDENGD